MPSGVTATNSGTTITQTAPFTAMAGGVIVFRNSTERDAGTYQESQLGWLADTNVLQQYDGSAWSAVTPASSTGSPTLSTNITNKSGYTPRLEKNGNIVILQFGVTNSASTATATPGSGTSMMTLPAGFRPTANTLVFGSGVNNSGLIPITFTVDTSGVVKANPSSALGSGADLYGTVSFSVA